MMRWWDSLRENIRVNRVNFDFCFFWHTNMYMLLKGFTQSQNLQVFFFLLQNSIECNPILIFNWPKRYRVVLFLSNSILWVMTYERCPLSWLKVFTTELYPIHNNNVYTQYTYGLLNNNNYSLFNVYYTTHIATYSERDTIIIIANNNTTNIWCISMLFCWVWVCPMLFFPLYYNPFINGMLMYVFCNIEIFLFILIVTNYGLLNMANNCLSGKLCVCHHHDNIVLYTSMLWAVTWIKKEK